MHEAIYRNVAYCRELSGLMPFYLTIGLDGEAVWANPVITSDRVAELDISSRVDLSKCRLPAPEEVHSLLHAGVLGWDHQTGKCGSAKRASGGV